MSYRRDEQLSCVRLSYIPFLQINIKHSGSEIKFSLSLYPQSEFDRSECSSAHIIVTSIGKGTVHPKFYSTFISQDGLGVSCSNTIKTHFRKRNMNVFANDSQSVVNSSMLDGSLRQSSPKDPS